MQCIAIICVAYETKGPSNGFLLEEDQVSLRGVSKQKNPSCD